MSDHTPARDISRLDAEVEAAAEHHRAGRLEEAEAGYRAVLETAVDHWRALNNLGALYLQRKEPEAAIPLLTRALQSPAGAQQAWPGLAQALILTERFHEAEALLAARPTEDQRLQALKLRLRQAWAIALRKAGELEAARAQYEAAWGLAPDDAHTNGDLGYIHMHLLDARAAEPFLLRAKELAPDDPPILINYASALRALGRGEEAERFLKDLLVREPKNRLAIRSLVQLLTDAGRYEEILQLSEEAEANGLPGIARAIRGEALGGLGRYEESLELLDQVAQERPEPIAFYRRAHARLLLQQFEGGWQDWESRWQVDSFLRDSSAFVLPELMGDLDLSCTAEDLVGQRVLVVSEQGIGDQVMYASMLPDVARAASKVVCVCQRRLHRLFANSMPQVEFMSPPDASVRLSDFDRIVPLGSLGRLYRNRAEDFPGTPFLKPTEEAVRQWADRLGPANGRLRVGISWRGGAKTTRMAQRSMTLAHLEPVLSIGGCEFVNMQYGDVAAEIEAFNAGRENPVRVFPAEQMKDFDDLAGLVANLDIVVSVQTALVHLSGAIGKECLTLIPRHAEWRYTARSPTMPWYGSVRLFRRGDGEPWRPVIERVAHIVRERAG